MSRRPLPVLYDGKRYPSAAALAEAAGVSRAMICQVIAEKKLFRGKPILRTVWVSDEADVAPRDRREEKKDAGVPWKRALLARTVTHGLGLAGRS